MGIPKPFSRPSVALADDVKRDWQSVLVSTLAVGDVVPGYGRVEVIDTYPEETHVTWKNGDLTIFAPGDTVTAFVKV